MAGTNLNSVSLTGNLTKDPELRTLQSGDSVCGLRLAVNGRAKVSGEWTEKAHYFDVSVWGAQGENCARFLVKGRPVALHGRLEFREWETDKGEKRSHVSIVADHVQFLGSRDDNQQAGGFDQRQAQPTQAQPVQQPVAQPVAAAGQVRGNDDIPFAPSVI